MRAPYRSSYALRAAGQRGQAMLLSVLLLGVGVSAIVFSFVTPAKTAIESDKKTAAALKQARDALIGRAAADQTIPGSLPCPDTDDDGSAELFAGNQCPAYLGRLPWRTLGLPDLRDGSGERLWYALSPNFRDDSSASPLNSDTAGQLAITGITPAANVIAIIFAPGPVLGTQDRSTAASSLCSTTGTTILNNRCPANYLEGENANGLPPTDITFTTGLPSAAFNDKLLAITSDALFNVVIVRVAKEAIAALEKYRGAPNNIGYYPYANPYGTVAPYSCSSGLFRGRFPTTPSGCGQADWPAGTLPAWFGINNWSQVTHYAISKGCAQLGLDPLVEGQLQSLCDLQGNMGSPMDAALASTLKILGISLTDEPLTVAGVTTHARVLVVVTGRALSVQVHPCASAGQCLEDAANTDGDANYVKPSRFPTSNDRMAMVCGSSFPCGVLP